ncbi:MAG: YdeI/OmpD-associated family protein [Pseudomonadota bacterium]
MKSYQSKLTIRFRAKLSLAKNKSEIFFVLPKSTKLSAGDVVEGIINTFPFRAALESNKGSLWVRVSEAMQGIAGVSAGDTVAVEITRVGEEAEIRIPLDLRKALAADVAAQALWDETTPMARRDWVLWIGTVKQLGTRKIRIEKACSMLAAGKRRVCCFGGLKWLTKDYPSSEDIWVPLPGLKKKGLVKS